MIPFESLQHLNTGKTRVFERPFSENCVINVGFCNFCYSSCWSFTTTWRTNRRTDGRTDSQDHTYLLPCSV